MLSSTFRLVVVGFIGELDGNLTLKAQLARGVGTISLPLTQQQKGNLAVGDEIILDMHDAEAIDAVGVVAMRTMQNSIDELSGDLKESQERNAELISVVNGCNVLAEASDKNAAELRATILDLQDKLTKSQADLAAMTAVVEKETAPEVVAPTEIPSPEGVVESAPIVTDPAPTASATPTDPVVP